MMWIVIGIIVVLVIALFMGLGSLWSRHMLWWFLQFSDAHKYQGKVAGDLNALHKPAVVVTSHTSILLAALLRRYTHRAVYVVQDKRVSSRWVRQLLWRNRIHLISRGQAVSRQNKGIILINLDDFEKHLLNTKMPVVLAYVCGAGHVRFEDGRKTRQFLYIKVQSFSGEQTIKAIQKAMECLGAHTWSEYVDGLPPLAEQWLYHAKLGGNRLSVADSTGVALTHHRFLVAVMSLREQLAPLLEGQTRVGVCLPPSVAGCTTLMVLLTLGKTLVNLNYTASPTALQSSIEEAGVRTIITSHLFVQTLKKKGFDVGEVFHKSHIIHLEDIRRKINKMTLLQNLVRVKLFSFYQLRDRLILPVSIDSVAAILFSSGSEGKPKGVELTQKNMVGNAKQAAEAMEATGNDVMLGLLPIFHAFGLTATTLLPLIEGIPVVCHPDPRDAVAIGHLVQQYRGTIMCGTSTFFRLYAKSRGLTPEMFSSVRYVVAGAERLQPEVRQMFEEKFNKIIYEGYGTTELTPVASANRPEVPGKVRYKKGSIGYVIPGCLPKVVDPETNQELPIGEAGMLAVGGVNVMRGYLNNPAKTAEVIFESEGLRFYKTGDKAKMDEDGFITILDRYSRFAKLGGEMVSLTAVESQIVDLLKDDETEVLAVAVPDIRKGEVVVLLIAGAADADKVQQLVNTSSMNNLMKPDSYFKVEAIPKLGTGKSDFSAAKKLVLELIGKA